MSGRDMEFSELTCENHSAGLDSLAFLVCNLSAAFPVTTSARAENESKHGHASEESGQGRTVGTQSLGLDAHKASSSKSEALSSDP